MKLSFLGTGNAFAPQRDWSSILVNDRILLDAGPSMLVNLKRLKANPATIRYLFISHFHGDHFLGVPFLLLEYHFITRTDEPLTIIGPPGVEEHIRQLMELAYPDVVRLGWPRPMQFIEAQANTTQSVDDLTFSAIRMAHMSETMIAYGYRLHLPDGVLAYSGDTSMTSALFQLVAGAQVIILEASSEETSTVHLGKEALRTLLARIGEDSIVFFTHFDTPEDDPWQGFNAIVPHDLESYDITLSTGLPPEVSHV
ncbi:MAG: MBL fold metallo-hydrolase [Armatimonadota bacterium]